MAPASAIRVPPMPSMIVDGLAAVRAPSTSSSFLVAVQASLAAAHDALNATPAPGALPGGATCVVLMAWRDHFTCLWAGDSRLYQLRNRAIRRVTRDHSRVRELVEAGEIDEDEVDDHPEANVVTRAIGAGTVFEPEVARGSLLRGDSLLLCSDGVTRVLGDHRLAEIMGGSAPEAAAEAVIEAVLAGGAPDNASAVVVTVL